MCGIIGVRLTRDEGLASDLALNLLLRLQHRGQDGAGLTVLTQEGNLETARGLGLIDVALKNLAELSRGNAAIAHSRYATTGTGSVSELQPFVKGAPRFALAHNGNIVNTDDLIEKFKIQTETANDLEVIQQIFIQALPQGFEHGVQTLFNELNGSYAVVGLSDDGDLFAFRDPFGIRPLFFAESDLAWAFGSETAALQLLSPRKVTEVQPGEWYRISKEGKITSGRLTAKGNPERKKKFCMFESVYFSSPQSEVGGSSVYRQRFNLGQVLAHEIEQKITGAGQGLTPKDVIDYVVPVPDTSRSAALAVAETLGIPYREFLVKNNYVPRTFILGKQDQRLKALNQKLSLIGPEIKGNKILLVDDSVVRGNTSRLMAERLREAGAKNVSLASTCPPIRHGCFYGIDFPDPRELVAHDRDVSAIAKELGVDHLHYISIEGLKRALGTNDLCMACLDGKYPTFDESFATFLKRRRDERGETVRS